MPSPITGTAAPMQGMTVKQCSGMSIELNRGSGDSSELQPARRRPDTAGHVRTGAYQFVGKRFQRLSVPGGAGPLRGLYDEELLMPEYYKRTTQRVINCLNPIVLYSRSTPLRECSSTENLKQRRFYEKDIYSV